VTYLGIQACWRHVHEVFSVCVGGVWLLPFSSSAAVPVTRISRVLRLVFNRPPQRAVLGGRSVTPRQDISKTGRAGNYRRWMVFRGRPLKLAPVLSAPPSAQLGKSLAQLPVRLPLPPALPKPTVHCEQRSSKHIRHSEWCCHTNLSMEKRRPKRQRLLVTLSGHDNRLCQVCSTTGG
jgi:hypothetical protein